MNYKFHTNLDKGECITRLSTQIKSDWTFTDKDSLKIAVGKVDGDNFNFEMVQKPGMRGMSPTPKKFSGLLRSVNDGTEISGTISSSGTNKFAAGMAVGGWLFLLVVLILKYGLDFIKILFATVIMAGVYFFFPRMNKNDNLTFLKSLLEVEE